MSPQRIGPVVVIEVKRFNSLRLQHFLITLHRRTMQPQFLLVELNRIPRIAKVQAILDQHDSGGLELEPRVATEQLIRKDEQVQCLLSMR